VPVRFTHFLNGSLWNQILHKVGLVWHGGILNNYITANLLELFTLNFDSRLRFDRFMVMSLCVQFFWSTLYKPIPFRASDSALRLTG